jgi:hypothetical protein
VSACSPPDRQRRRFLARRLRHDLEAGFQGIVVFDELQFGGTAAEQFGEQLFEVLVDDLKRSQQPFARFVIEAVDALAQPPDCLDQIVALGGQLAVLPFDLSQFLLGEQVDRAEPFAFRLDALDLAFDLGD